MVLLLLLLFCNIALSYGQAYSLCSTPATAEGCSTLSAADCALYTGCTYTASTKRCQQNTTCNEVSCKLKDLAYRISANQLPACVNGHSQLCNEQKIKVFRALKLGELCFAEEPVEHGNHVPLRSDVGSLEDFVLYVSPQGLDTNKGNSKSKPLQTLQKAVELTRLAPQGVGRKHIFLMQGVHRMKATVTLLEEDSNLTIEGLDGAVLSASEQLPKLEWTQLSLGSRIYVADLSKLPMNQFGVLSRLFRKGVPQNRAQTPNANNYEDHNRFPPGGNVDGWSHNAFKPAATTVRQQITTPESGVFRYQIFNYGYGGQCTGMFEPAVGYWCDPKADGDSGCPLDWPSGVTLKDSLASFINLKTGWSYNTTTPAYFHTLHVYKWGGWTFEITKASGRTISFGKGGFQEARGDCGKGGSDFMIENVFELLDYWHEYFLDYANKKLFVFSDGMPQHNVLETMELGVNLSRVIQVLGTTARPVRNVKLLNLVIKHTYATHMHTHEMPSGGDVAIHRGGAIFLEGVEHVTVADCTFEYLGTNGLFVSKYARQVDILRNEFAFIEGTPIVLVGDPKYEAKEPWDRRYDGDYVGDVQIINNLIHDVGLVEMQGCPVLLSITRNVLVEKNVMFTGPRGAVVLNDIFGGNHLVRRNVIFDFVTQTFDHGPYNVWSRQQWMLPDNFAGPVIIEWNMIIGTPDGGKLIDLDDGADNHRADNNILVDGYVKFKGYSLSASSNVIVGLQQFQQWGCLLMLDKHRAVANWTYADNSCFLGGTLPTYTWRSSTQNVCDISELMFKNNRQNGFFINWREWRCGATMKEWQALGQDVGSTWNRDLAPATQIIQECEAKAVMMFATEAPTPLPTARPSQSPSMAPTTSLPTMMPTTSTPSLSPTATPTKKPTKLPTPLPTRKPTVDPTAKPTKQPTAPPTKKPTKQPTVQPTKPTPQVTLEPTTHPSQSPTSSQPTHSPTAKPTKLPTAKPTSLPSQSPTTAPTRLPTANPTLHPSQAPSVPAPTTSPTTSTPTASPTVSTPTASPNTSKPSVSPTFKPSQSPTTRSPSTSPVMPAPSAAPTNLPTTNLPSFMPSALPTYLPSLLPTLQPIVSDKPTTLPTKFPTTNEPSSSPTEYQLPTLSPVVPVRHPSKSPTLFPTWHTPSKSPSEYGFPTKAPLTTSPTFAPVEEEDKDLDAGALYIYDDEVEEDGYEMEEDVYKEDDQNNRDLVSVTVDAKGNQGFLI